MTVKNMQTDGKLFLRVSKTSTIGEVSCLSSQVSCLASWIFSAFLCLFRVLSEIRSKMMDVLGLPRSALAAESCTCGQLINVRELGRELFGFVGLAGL